MEGVDYILPPKTKKSRRTVELPSFICQIMSDYIKRLYNVGENGRIFPITRSAVEHKLETYVSKANVKPIRVHDLRHSHASMLIEMNVPILLISQRLGHENVETTLQTYSHLYPSRIDETIAAMEQLYNRCPHHAPTLKK